jgi:hypothetical protein
MGIGAIIMLVVGASIAANKANRFIEEGEVPTAIWVGILFAIDVAILAAGNPWVWAGWTLVGVLKMIFLPGPDLVARAERSPLIVHQLSIVISVLFNGGFFALFQWLR